jgi:predicted  nucleic acid-binding Zn-ribbon protein
MAIQSQQIEKKSLEAHVDLCAERYKELNTTITKMNERIDSLENHILDLKDEINKITRSVNNRIITISGATVGVLATAVIALTVKLIN